MCQRVLPLLIGFLLTCQSASALDDFTMGISTMHIGIAYLYIGKERGFYADEGIELKLIHIPAYLARTALIARQRKPARGEA